MIDSLQSLGLQGQGTRVAIIDDSLYEPAWLDGYRTCFGLSGATAVTPHVIGSPDMSEAGETILDLSVMSFVAPEVDRFDVFMVDPTLDPNVTDLPGQLIAMFGAPLDASQTGGQVPDVVSASFGACEALQMFFQGKTAAVSILESVLATAAAAGVSYFVATGDSGSSACLHALSFLPLPPDPAETVLSVQYPATSAWVTAVGGTNLALRTCGGCSGVGGVRVLGFGGSENRWFLSHSRLRSPRGDRRYAHVRADGRLARREGPRCAGRRPAHCAAGARRNHCRAGGL
jgi:kumamolisin